MKKFTIFSLGMLLGGMMSTAQTNYQTVFLPKTQWEIYKTDASATGISQKQSILKDTTFNGNTYKVFAQDQSNLSQNHVYLREDITEKKVFAYEDGKEFILYDFNLKVGDKFYLKQWEFEVINVAKVETFDGEKQCIELKPISKTWDNIKWIEGIGSTIAPLYYKHYGKLTESSQVTCFFRNGKLIYSVNDWNCAAPVGTKNINDLARSVVASPNPFQGNLRLQVLNPSGNALSVTISSPTGAVLMQQKFNEASDRLDTTLDLQNMNSGVLFLTVKTNEGQTTKRIVKE
jgi:hypothetical protein